ncbi:hypothetical protein CJ030_MR5G020299 [Morella rubra]|uniref:F-box domain-containing protein n=1 Tax=Morella rubra TaxID=262757 RepID=A0A6A1VL26_9ROSI|nr:hypothetical protein CJ030_MR5G020317 [Morella rubra]KAB1213632.1 hypothetical protein CJ030_MR5G020299 [Morella rubra]
MSFENLHEDIIIEILLRLRAKSLVRFRCASKGWLSLITDPRFAHRHLKRVSEHPQRVLSPSFTGIRSLGVDELCGDSFPLKELVLPFKDCDVSILGTCNGLVWVSRYEDRDFYIWNPSTADCRKLPDPWIEPSWKGHRYLHGFGYDLSSDDYKVLLATSRDGFQPLVSAAQVQVFSLKTNSWEQIQYTALDDPSEPVFWPWQSLGTFSNGALHWKVEWREPNFRHGIIAFDLAEEKFRDVPIPMDEARIYIHYLSNLGGRLCFTCDRNCHVEV